MAGRNVTRAELDIKLAEAVLAIREAMTKVNTINGFLAQVPVGADGVDPLTISTSLTDPMDPNSAPGKFGYTQDEAQVIRLVFQQLNELATSTSISATLLAARKLTGLD